MNQIFNTDNVAGYYKSCAMFRIATVLAVKAIQLRGISLLSLRSLLPHHDKKSRLCKVVFKHRYHFEEYYV